MKANPYSPFSHGGPRMFNPAKTNHKENCPARIVMPPETTLERLALRFRWAQSGVRLGQTVFGWTTQNFPFSVKTAPALKIPQPHVITVTGKAFYDIGHAPADHSNRRSTLDDESGGA